MRRPPRAAAVALGLLFALGGLAAGALAATERSPALQRTDLLPKQAAPPSPGEGIGAVEAGVVLASVAASVALAWKCLVPMAWRLDRRRVLEHPLRARLLALAKERPGLSVQEAAVELGVAPGTALHHLRVLEHAGVLASRREGRHRRILPVALSAAETERAIALAQPRSAALYGLVLQRPGIGLREAARSLGVPVSSLVWHVERLERARLLRRLGSGLEPAGEA
jgi:DNA-binding transcriptional ArsR family regulator